MSTFCRGALEGCEDNADSAEVALRILDGPDLGVCSPLDKLEHG